MLIMVYNGADMPQHLKIGNEKFDDIYKLPTLNGNVPYANLDALRTRYVETLLYHAEETQTELPRVIAEKLVTVALEKQVKQARNVGLQTRIPIGLSTSHDIERLKEIASDIETGGIEVASFTQLGQNDMFYSKVGNAVARIVRDEANMHEAPLGRKIFRVPDTPYGDGHVHDYAIITTKASIARLEDSERSMDVISRQTGFIDMSTVEDEETAKALKIMGRVYELGLNEGYDTIIEAARARVGRLFVDPDASSIYPALGSVYLKISRAGECLTESGRSNA